MARPSTNQRMFVAVHPPEDAVRSMLESLRDLELPAHRLVPIEQVHLTLQFIGDTPVAKIDTVTESVARSVAGVDAFELMGLRLIVLPKRGDARLTAMETDAPGGLLEIQRRLTTRLARRVRHDPGDRFLPHLTLCRFTGRLPARDVQLPGNGPPGVSFSVRFISLMRSVLRSGGAVHERVESFQLQVR